MIMIIIVIRVLFYSLIGLVCKLLFLLLEDKICSFVLA